MTAARVQCGLLTVEQFAEWTQVSRTTAYAKVATGEIESVKIGRLRRIPIAAVERYVERLLSEQSSAIREAA